MQNLIKILVFSCLTGFVSCENINSVNLLEEQKVLSNRIVLREVKIFNGIDSAFTKPMDLIIENGTITRIGESLNLENLQGVYEVQDVKGKYVMPGMIDAHVHISGNGDVPWTKTHKPDPKYNMQAYLYSGVTTLYDLGGLGSSLEDLDNKVKGGELIGCDLFHAHIPISVKDGHPIPISKEAFGFPLSLMANAISPTISSPEEASDIIEKYLKNDVDYVKIICDEIPVNAPQISKECLTALIKETHKRGYKAFVHIGSQQNALDAIEAGADVLAHGVWRGELTDEQAKQIGQSGVPIIYTLAGFKNVSQIYEGNYTPSALDKKLVPAEILTPVTGANGLEVKTKEAMGSFFHHANENTQYWEANFTKLHQAGATIVVGTDSGLPGTYAGSTYMQEIQLLKLLGMSNLEILTGATSTASKLFLDNPDFGTIEVGKKAHLIFLSDNPLEDINALNSLELVIKNDLLIKRK